MTAFVLFDLLTRKPLAILWRRDQVGRWRTSNRRIISEIDISHIDHIADNKLGFDKLPISAIFEGMTRYHGQA